MDRALETGLWCLAVSIKMLISADDAPTWWRQDLEAAAGEQVDLDFCMGLIDRVTSTDLCRRGQAGICSDRATQRGGR